MYLTQNSQIVFKFWFLSLFILLTAGSSLYGLQDVRELPELTPIEEDQQVQQPESGSVGTKSTESEFRRIELLEKTMLEKLSLESLPIVTQNERPALGSPVIRAFLQKYGIDLDHFQNEEDDIDDEIKNQTLLITAKQQLVADHRRRKRNAANQQSCQQENGTNGCCLRDFNVNFHDIGWDWIIHPQSYNAKDCAGECSLQQTTNIHSRITKIISEMSTTTESAGNGQPNQRRSCCVPTKYAPLNLLYYDAGKNVVYSTVPDMVVTKCECV